MKRIMIEILLFILAGILLTGCGSVRSSRDGGTAGENAAVRSSLIPGDGKSEVQSGHRWGNDANYYTASKYGTELFQYDLKWNVVNTIEMEISQVLWVTDQWIYYETLEGEEYESCLWRVPIESTRKGDRVKKKEKERLFRRYDMEIVHATDTCLILYIEHENEEGGIYRYELDCGRWTELLRRREPENINIVYDNNTDDPVVMNGELLMEENGKLICLDLDTGKESKVYACHERDTMVEGVRSGKDFYFLDDNDLCQYDSSDKRVSCLITEKSFREAVRRTGENKFVESCDEIYLEGGKLYIEDTTGEKRKNGKGQEVIYYRTELYSAPVKNPGQISREDILLDYLDQAGTYEWAQEEKCFEHTSGIDDVIDGNVVADYPVESGCYETITYDLETKKVKKVRDD